MRQECEVRYVLYCNPQDTQNIIEWLKTFFSTKETMYGAEVTGFDIYDTIKQDELADKIIIGINVEREGKVVKGFRFDPPEPASVEDLFTIHDFYWYLSEILPDRYNIDIDIDTENSVIPTEQDILEEIVETQY